MSLPVPLDKKFFQKRNLEALLLPTIVVILLLGILSIGVFVSFQDDGKTNEDKKNLSYYTEKRKVSSKGKTIEVDPRVLQISPKDLSQELSKEEPIKVVTIIKNISEQNKPHIKGTIFMLESMFESTPGLNPEDSHVFISEDGYDSAVVIEKFVGGFFPPEKNRNLEGGLKAWKKEGLPLEN